jgi:Flp pilus assembly protein CpaB
MEAEYTGERRRRRIIVLAGLVLAVLAAGAVYYLLTTRPTSPPSATTRTVVVAARDIPARTTIEAAMLSTKQVPDDPALANVLSDPAVAINSVAVFDIRAGDLVTPSMFGSGTQAGLPILAPGETIAPDSPIWRAVSVSVPADRAVAGLIQAQDHIDLFVTLTPQLFDPSGGVPASFPLTIVDPDHNGPMTLGYYSASTTKLTWTDLEVLNVD